MKTCRDQVCRDFDAGLQSSSQKGAELTLLAATRDYLSYSPVRTCPPQELAAGSKCFTFPLFLVLGCPLRHSRAERLRRRFQKRAAFPATAGTIYGRSDRYGKCRQYSSRDQLSDYVHGGPSKWDYCHAHRQRRFGLWECTYKAQNQTINLKLYPETMSSIGGGPRRRRRRHQHRLCDLRPIAKARGFKGHASYRRRFGP